MKKFLIFLIFFKLVFTTSIKAYSTDPKEFIFELVNDAISKLSDKNLSIEQKAEFIEEIAL